MFMAFCKQMNATPTISVRFQGGTPEAAAALVHYANIEQKYNVVYWSIGNEPNSETENGKKIDPVDFNPRWRAIAQAMKAVDPTIKLLGPEIGQWGTDISKTPKYPPIQTPTGQERQDWMTDFLKANGDLVDIVAVHRYPMYAPTSPTPITIDNLRQNTLEWGPMVTYLRDMIHQITGRDLPIAFTEVNSDPSAVVGGVASPDSFYNAIWYADVLGRLIQQHVFMVNQWVFAYRSGGLGLIYGSELRPTYYVFQIYSHFGNEQVFASSGVAEVTIYAATRADGTLTILVINLSDTEQRIPLQIQGMALSKAGVWLFDATHKAEDLGQQSFPSDGGLILPAQSISLYAIGK
jgi:alpha-L-arabinofuranosidase